MSRQWPVVALGHVTCHRKEFTRVDEFRVYKRCRVQLHAKGIVLRDVVLGSEIKTKEQQVCRAGELLVAEIDAKVGGFGIVPEDLNGAIVSSHYFLFQLNAALVDRQFLGYFVRTPYFYDQVTAQGSTNYAAIRPNHVLEYKIPLPPLDEQRRIVARIEALAAKIEEARGLRECAVRETAVLLMSASSRLFASIDDRLRPTAKLGSLTDRITKGESPEWQGYSYQEEGTAFIRSENVLWGRLELTNAAHIPDEFHQKLSRSQLRPGDVLINLVGASIGRSAVFNEQMAANVNQAVAVISPKPKDLDSQYLMRFLNSGDAQRVIHGGKVETARPNISLGDLNALEIPVAPLSEQAPHRRLPRRPSGQSGRAKVPSGRNRRRDQRPFTFHFGQGVSW